MTPAAGSANTCARAPVWRARRCALVVALTMLFVAAHAGASDEWEYEVRRGDTLWSLALRYLDGVAYVPPLQRLNRVENPRQLPPGLRLRIPYEWTRSTPANARLVAVTGEVRVEPAAGAQPYLATVSALLGSGDRVITPRDGSVLLEFMDGSRMLILADSSVRLTGLRSAANGASDARVHVERGRTESTVKPRSDRGTRFRIETPAGITSVRGTAFRVAAGSGSMRTEVLTGAVGVDAEGTGIRLDAGYGARVRAGEAPGAPVALLPAPDLTSIPPRLERRPATLAVPALSGAHAYRLQVARGAVLEEIVVDESFAAMPLPLPELANGRYLLRVRGIDGIGLEGMQGDRTIDIDVRPPAPFPDAPRDDAVSLERRPVLRWRAVDARLHYRVQVAADEGFEAPLFDVREVEASQWQVPGDLAPGRHTWRVAATSRTEGSGEFGPAASFRVSAEPPARLGSRVRGGELSLMWSDVQGAAAYRVQLARDEGFETMVLDQRVNGTGVRLVRPAAGRYFLRVTTLDAQGEPGPFSSPHPVKVAQRYPFWLLPLVPLLFLL